MTVHRDSGVQPSGRGRRAAAFRRTGTQGSDRHGSMTEARQSDGPAGVCRGRAGRRAGRGSYSDGDSLLASGTVGAGQAGEACAQARWQGRDTGTGGPGARAGPGKRDPANKRSRRPGPGELCGRCWGPETGQEKLAAAPGARGPVTSSTRRVTGGQRRAGSSPCPPPASDGRAAARRSGLASAARGGPVR